MHQLQRPCAYSVSVLLHPESYTSHSKPTAPQPPSENNTTNGDGTNFKFDPRVASGAVAGSLPQTLADADHRKMQLTLRFGLRVRDLIVWAFRDQNLGVSVLSKSLLFKGLVWGLGLRFRVIPPPPSPQTHPALDLCCASTDQKR